jgi:hypothetical protein
MNSNLRDLAYRLDPALWVQQVLGINPTEWQQTFLRAPRGAAILALTARQCGKTTTAAWAMAHGALFVPNSLSVVACPAQRDDPIPGAAFTAEDNVDAPLPAGRSEPRRNGTGPQMPAWHQSGDMFNVFMLMGDVASFSIRPWARSEMFRFETGTTPKKKRLGALRPVSTWGPMSPRPGRAKRRQPTVSKWAPGASG